MSSQMKDARWELACREAESIGLGFGHFTYMGWEDALLSDGEGDLTLQWRWEPEIHNGGVLINEYLNETLQNVQYYHDEALRTVFIQYLRMIGYIVVEPEGVLRGE